MLCKKCGDRGSLQSNNYSQLYIIPLHKESPSCLQTVEGSRNRIETGPHLVVDLQSPCQRSLPFCLLLHLALLMLAIVFMTTGPCWSPAAVDALRGLARLDVSRAV